MRREMTDVRWIYHMNGSPAYYQKENTVYTADSKPAYNVSGGWWYAYPVGPATYYINGNTVFNIGGQPVYYYYRE